MNDVDPESWTDHPSRDTQAAPDAAGQAYVEVVRAAIARLAVRTAEGEGARGALAVLEDVAVVDIDVPVMSRSRGGRYVKTGVKMLAGWYLRYLGQQVTTLGRATSDLGAALIERSDRLEEAGAALATRVADLEARLTELEQR